MAKSVSFTQLYIYQITINIEQQQVQVNYRLTDDSGLYLRNGVAVFYKDLPNDIPIPPAVAIPLPDDAFQLSSTRVTQMVGIYNDVKAALTAKFLT